MSNVYEPSPALLKLLGVSTPAPVAAPAATPGRLNEDVATPAATPAATPVQEAAPVVEPAPAATPPSPATPATFRTVSEAAEYLFTKVMAEARKCADEAGESVNFVESEDEPARLRNALIEALQAEVAAGHSLEEATKIIFKRVGSKLTKVKRTITSQEKRANKLEYRQNRAQAKRAAKRFRRSAKGRKAMKLRAKAEKKSGAFQRLHRKMGASGKAFKKMESVNAHSLRSLLESSSTPLSEKQQLLAECFASIQRTATMLEGFFEVYGEGADHAGIAPVMARLAEQAKGQAGLVESTGATAYADLERLTKTLHGGLVAFDTYRVVRPVYFGGN